MQQVPQEYDEFANSFNEEVFQKIMREETKEEVEQNLNDELPI